MKKQYVSVVMMIAGLAACGSSYAANSPPTTTGPATNPTATPSAGSPVAVKLASSPFGQILVDNAGNTLYAFAKDTDARPTCTGACAQTWPAAIVTTAWSVAPGLDAGVFRGIGSASREQLIAGKWPLYRFAGDARPGDINGQGFSGVWFVVDGTGKPVHGDGTAPATTISPASPANSPLYGPR